MMGQILSEDSMLVYSLTPGTFHQSCVIIRRHPAIFIVLVMNITRPLAIESANAPTNAANSTYDTVNENFNIGVSHSGANICISKAIAATSSALSASDEKNCAAMMT
jgi:hypothetical protein